ncbi:LysM peptidoglycan-binding domain-containing protein, partial [bacterium]|nr:LysM peptidoglycan-binding domain-containing protein [bacterium]
MRRGIALCTFCFILIFLVGPFITEAAPSKNKAKQQSSKNIKKNAKQSKKHTAKKGKQSRNETKGQGLKAQVEPVTYENDGEYIEYKIKRGDTIDKIAALFSIDKDELIETNQLASKKKLDPGKTLFIPRVIEESDDAEEIVNFKSAQVKPWKNSDERYVLVKVAKSFMGAPYKYGGNTVRGLDCSAYVKKIYEIFDVQLPRSAREQHMV